MLRKTGRGQARTVSTDRASMRPQRNAAENVVAGGWGCGLVWGFNEAAA